MKVTFLPLIGLSFALFACSGNSGSKSGLYHPNVGPFDENGNYVEALADAPVRKNIFPRKSRSARKSKEKAAKVAKAPKRSQRSKSSKPSRSQSITSSAPRTVVITPSPKPTQAKAKSKPKPKPTTSTTVARPKPKPQSKPKPVLVKPKKPAPVRHRVASSDTLYGLSRKYGVTVAAIQRANGLKGTTIVTGRTLLIPR